MAGDSAPADPLTPIENARTSNKEDAAGPSLPWWSRYLRWRQTSSVEATHAEKILLDLVGAPLVVKDVSVGPRKEEYLHTIVGGNPDGPPMVLMPGYAAGSGFWFRNLVSLTRDFKVHAVDWLGTGLSGRPSFTARSREEAEAFFCDSLKVWMGQMGLEKVVLVGHSLGGYLAATYALKYPEDVEHLVLVCPAGIPRKPDEWEKRLIESQWSLRAQFINFARWAWNSGLTPGSFIRTLGPWGPGLIRKYVAGRFAHHDANLDESEANSFQEYFYHIAAAPGSGEYALRHLLAPGAWAHHPLEDRLHELPVPVTFIYGQHDWMRPEYGIRLVDWLKEHRKPLNGGDLKVFVVPESGHFVFVDRPDEFNKALKTATAHLLPPAARAALKDDN